MQNIFETAAAITPELQKANWNPGPYGGIESDKPIDITSHVKSADEMALVSQVLTRVLSEAPYFPKSPSLLIKPELPAPEGKFLLSVSLPDDSQIDKFKADDSLSSQRASQPRISAAAPRDLKDTIQHVRDESVKEWTRSAQGDYYQTLAVSHGGSGSRLLYNEHNPSQVNSMLRHEPGNKDLPPHEMPRIWIAVDGRMDNMSAPVLLVQKQHAKQVLVDLLGLDAKKLAIPSAPSLE